MTDLEIEKAMRLEQSSKDSPLVYKQIPKVMADFKFIEKTGYNDKQNFTYMKAQDAITALHPIMATHGLFVVPNVLSQSYEEKPTKSGGIQKFWLVKVQYTMYAEDGSYISAMMTGEAADTGDKGINKAMTISLKYFLLQVFLIPTKEMEDPDGSTSEIDFDKAKQTKPKTDKGDF